jgi:hypothetical protein
METAEIFSEPRMRRCVDIARQIYNQGVKVKFKDDFYIVRDTESVTGVSLNDFKQHYFGVGVSRNKLVDVPFIDLLVIFEAVKSLIAQGRSRKSAGEPVANFGIKTAFTNEEAMSLLQQILIRFPESPGGILLGFQESVVPLEDEEEGDSHEL